MAFVRNAVWWVVFSAFGVMAQAALPGVDFLVPGLVVSLQEERWNQSLWLALAFTLIQEGSGNLQFGSGLVWYGAVMCLFFVGRWLLEAKSITFIIVLGAGLGLWHYLLVKWTAFLQELVISDPLLIRESCIMAVMFPLLWMFVSWLRKGRDRDVLAA
ncbi:MAG: hypothetical protein D6E12_18795 [Desulfovibrio sp.]|nr:MAG: hypothetical protein D6E12_18795 [Desulfovibrio sp.]